YYDRVHTHMYTLSLHDALPISFDGYDEEDVKGLLKDRLAQAKDDLDNSLEAVRALCEPVKAPRALEDYQHYFCGVSGENSAELLDRKSTRLNSSHVSISYAVFC